jgi:hypothetical protein
MYKQYLEIKNCKNGKGLFTTVQIPANSMILEVTGSVWSDKEVPDMNHPALLQIGPNSYIGPSGEGDDYINHHCDPNCWMNIVGNRAFLYSLYVIPIDAELTFDYSITSTESYDSWKMNCNCGSYKCRRVISGAQYLDTPLIEKYRSKNMLPLYITNPGMMQSR